MHDKFFLCFDFTSDELNRINPEISLSGAELRRSGNFLNFQIIFGAPAAAPIALKAGQQTPFTNCMLYSYTECV